VKKPEESSESVLHVIHIPGRLALFTPVDSTHCRKTLQCPSVGWQFLEQLLGTKNVSGKMDRLSLGMSDAKISQGMVPLVCTFNGKGSHENPLRSRWVGILSMGDRSSGRAGSIEA
jgi:hypothetical protein